MTARSSAGPCFRVLQGGIEGGGQFSLSRIAAGDIGVADEAPRVMDGAAGDGHLAEVEGRAATAGTALDHDEPGLRPAQPVMGGQGSEGRKLRLDRRPLRPGKDCHPPLAAAGQLWIGHRNGHRHLKFI